MDLSTQHSFVPNSVGNKRSMSLACSFTFSALSPFLKHGRKGLNISWSANSPKFALLLLLYMFCSVFFSSQTLLTFCGKLG